MHNDLKRERFERLMLPHLDAAYGLARCLTRNDELAEDAVQEAYLRAFRFLGSLRGDDGRPWLLREIEGCSYKEIAVIVGEPIGTACHAWRARSLLQGVITQRMKAKETGT